MGATKTPLSPPAIGLIGSTGVVMGLATTLVGVPPTTLPLLWTAFYVVWVATVVRRSTPHPFLTIVLGSILSGALTGGIQSVLLARFRTANPWWAPQMERVSDADLRVSLLLQGLGAGVVFGVVFGAIAWAIVRRRGPRGRRDR